MARTPGRVPPWACPTMSSTLRTRPRRRITYIAVFLVDADGVEVAYRKVNVGGAEPGDGRHTQPEIREPA